MGDTWPWHVLLVGRHAGLVWVLVRRIGTQGRAMEQALLLHQRRAVPWEVAENEDA